jgi:hypothetical protein
LSHWPNYPERICCGSRETLGAEIVVEITLTRVSFRSETATRKTNALSLGYAMFYKQLFGSRAAFLLAMSCFLVGSAWGRDETPRAQVRSLALSTSYDCALLTDGRVKCWGGHSRGVNVPGNHKQNDFWATPITVGGLTDAIEIAVGGERGCAIIRNGSVMCWDARKKAGSAGEADHALTVDTLVGVTQLVMGDEHACVLLGGGTVKCWGENWLGQLGNGTKTPSSTPVREALIWTSLGLQALAA